MRLDGAATATVLNVDGTLARFGGDKNLLLEMTAILLEDAPRLARQLQSAVLTQNSSAIASHAHALKGLVAGCGGERAAQAAQALEDAGHRGILNHAASQFAKLEDELRSLFSAIYDYRNDHVQIETPL
jgi:HPt (histidine-containing phosphotransfer) domain-containing protein